MDVLSELHLGHKTISYKEIVGSGKKQLNFSEVGLRKQQNTQQKMLILL